MAGNFDNSQVVRELESSLAAKLAHVRFGTLQFEEISRKAGLKVGSLDWESSNGPTQFRIGHFGFKRLYDGDAPDFESIDLIFWPSKSGTGVQRLDAKRWTEEVPDHLERIEAYRFGDRLIECGAARFVGNRTWPAARIFRLKGERWNRVANQDPGYPVGSARFARRNGRIDPNRIVSVTFRDWHLSSPAGGPHLQYEQIWYVSGYHFRLGKAKLVPTAYAELDLLKGFADRRDRRSFDAEVPKGFRDRLWSLMRRAGASFWWSERQANGTRESFRAEEGAEDKHAPVVSLEKRLGLWRVSGID